MPLQWPWVRLSNPSDVQSTDELGRSGRSSVGATADRPLIYDHGARSTGRVIGRRPKTMFPSGCSGAVPYHPQQSFVRPVAHKHGAWQHLWLDVLDPSCIFKRIILRLNQVPLIALPLFKILSSCQRILSICNIVIGFVGGSPLYNFRRLT